MLCAFLLLSHGGIVAAHDHDDGHIDANSAISSDHIGGHSISGSEVSHAAVDRDEPGSGQSDPAQSPFAHSHVVVDGVARLPETVPVVIAGTSVRPVGRSYLKPASTVVAPGLEPPTV